MMVVLFKINNDRYAVDVKDVVEIIPRLSLQTIPYAPLYVSGLLNYRGEISPVVDISYLISGTPVRPLLSSRIILIQPDSVGGRHVGLLADHVTEALKISEDEFSDTGIGSETTAFIDKVAIDEAGMIRLVDVEKLLPHEIGVMLSRGKAVDNGGALTAPVENSESDEAV